MGIGHLAAIVFLCQNDSSNETGYGYVIDGGYRQ